MNFTLRESLSNPCMNPPFAPMAIDEFAPEIPSRDYITARSTSSKLDFRFFARNVVVSGKVGREVVTLFAGTTSRKEGIVFGK